MPETGCAAGTIVPSLLTVEWRPLVDNSRCVCPSTWRRPSGWLPPFGREGSRCERSGRVLVWAQVFVYLRLTARRGGVAVLRSLCGSSGGHVTWRCTAWHRKATWEPGHTGLTPSRGEACLLFQCLFRSLTGYCRHSSLSCRLRGTCPTSAWSEPFRKSSGPPGVGLCSWCSAQMKKSLKFMKW